MVVCGQTITAKVSHQNWCKVSQQKPFSYVVRQSPQKFHTRTGAKFHSKCHGRMWSDNHRKSFTPELVQSFTAKAMVLCRQTITAKVSHQNWCKVSQQMPWSYVVRQSPRKFHTRTGAKFHSKSPGRVSSDNHRKRFTPELVQSFTEKVMVVCGQTITAKVSHQNWYKVSQKKPWSYVVRQSPQKFHTRTGAKFHSKSPGRVSSDNHRKSFTPELVQSFTEKVMVICGQTITAKVSHQNWCKVSQQKPWSCVVRQSLQKFHTRTGAKFHSNSHGRMWSDNHRKSFTPELVQSFTEKVMVVCGQTITANVSHQNWYKVSQQKPWSYVLRQSLSWSALVVCHSEQILATNLFSEKSTLRACPLADNFRNFLQLTKRKPKFVSCQFLFVSFTSQLKTDCKETLQLVKMSDLALNLTLSKKNILYNRLLTKKKTLQQFVQFLPFVGSVFEKILHAELVKTRQTIPRHLSVGDDRIFVKIKKSYATANRTKKVN